MKKRRRREESLVHAPPPGSVAAALVVVTKVAAPAAGWAGWACAFKIADASSERLSSLVMFAFSELSRKKKQKLVESRSRTIFTKVAVRLAIVQL